MKKKQIRKKYWWQGGGISGVGAAGMLLRTGEPVILYDGNEKLDRTASGGSFGETVPEIVLGELTDEVISQVRACVISPGIPSAGAFRTEAEGGRNSHLERDRGGLPPWERQAGSCHRNQRKDDDKRLLRERS